MHSLVFWLKAVCLKGLPNILQVWGEVEKPGKLDPGPVRDLIKKACQHMCHRPEELLAKC